MKKYVQALLVSTFILSSCIYSQHRPNSDGDCFACRACCFCCVFGTLCCATSGISCWAASLFGSHSLPRGLLTMLSVCSTESSALCCVSIASLISDKHDNKVINQRTMKIQTVPPVVYHMIPLHNPNDANP